MELFQLEPFENRPFHKQKRVANKNVNTYMVRYFSSKQNFTKKKKTQLRASKQQQQ